MRLTPMPVEERAVKVLAVDDEPIILLGTVALLRSLGYEVATARNTREALALIKADPAINAVVTDYSMPGRSGLELIDTLQQMDRKLALVVTSGHLDLRPDNKDRWTRILKPFSRDELSDALNAAMAATV
jgi:CheY-like chemotaxis protein